MSKKLKKLCAVLMVIFVVTVASINMQVSPILQVQACSTIAECREQAQQTRDNIANLAGQEEGLGENLASIQNEISQSRSDIANAEIRIRGLVNRIEELEDEIEDLREQIYDTREIINETDERIEELIELISLRMRATQRLNNSNSTLTQLTTANNLNTFVQIVRDAQRVAANDASMMEELTELTETNRKLYESLQTGVKELEEQTKLFLELQANEEHERLTLAATQRQLLEDEQRLQGELDALFEEMLSEEERLAAIEAAEEILRRVPAPNSYGLAHPLPGAVVTSNFGPRWGTHHSGIDLVIPGDVRAPIFAAAAGTVTYAGWNHSFGWWVRIAHSINGERVDTVYAHLRYPAPVVAGEIVEQGQVIGIKGNTGHSFGAHLHFEVHPGGFRFGIPRGVDPRYWIQF